MTPTDAMHKAAVRNHAAHSTGPMMECAEPECITLRALPDDTALVTVDSLARCLCIAGATDHAPESEHSLAAAIIKAAKEGEA